MKSMFPHSTTLDTVLSFMHCWAAGPGHHPAGHSASRPQEAYGHPQYPPAGAGPDPYPLVPHQMPHGGNPGYGGPSAGSAVIYACQPSMQTHEMPMCVCVCHNRVDQQLVVHIHRLIECRCSQTSADLHTDIQAYIRFQSWTFDVDNSTI